MEEKWKEVYFGTYCQLCKYEDEEETGDHCDECLQKPKNMYSHKPVNFEEKE